MKTVLIVDDSRTTRNYHGAIASSCGYGVVMARDGVEGLEKLLMNPIDLILTDINMEGLDGYEFVRRVRASPGHVSVPIAIVSTQSEMAEQAKGFEAGANLYIVKPSDPDVLIKYLRMMLGDAS